jgi:hypothetical protein
MLHQDLSLLAALVALGRIARMLGLGAGVEQLLLIKFGRSGGCILLEFAMASLA